MNIDTQIDCVKRELKRRKRKYPALVENGKLTHVSANSEIAVMQSVYETLSQLKGILTGG